MNIRNQLAYLSESGRVLDLYENLKLPSINPSIFHTEKLK